MNLKTPLDIFLEPLASTQLHSQYNPLTFHGYRLFTLFFTAITCYLITDFFWCSIDLLTPFNNSLRKKKSLSHYLSYRCSYSPSPPWQFLIYTPSFLPFFNHSQHPLGLKFPYILCLRDTFFILLITFLLSLFKYILSLFLGTSCGIISIFLVTEKASTFLEQPITFVNIFLMFCFPFILFDVLFLHSFPHAALEQKVPFPAIILNK